MLRNEIDQLLQRPMERKEFLAYLGALLLMLLGISGLIRALLQAGESKQLTNRYEVQTVGYGSSSYGGAKS